MEEEGLGGVDGNLEHGAGAAVEVEGGGLGAAGVPANVAPGVDEGGEVGFAAAEGFHDFFGFFDFAQALLVVVDLEV